MTKLWKSMRQGMKSQHGKIKWQIGKWQKTTKSLKLCENGFHASTRIIDAMSFVNMEVLAEVEVRGESEEEEDKQVWSEMCILKAWKWTKKDSVSLAIFAAELVIDIFEKQYPKDDRPRKAIEAAKKWLKNPTKENASTANATHAADAASATYAANAANAADAAHVAAYASAASMVDAATYYMAHEEILNKTEKWIKKRINTLEEIK